ncbi:MAG: hypothetical protein ACR2QC_10200, partial [Gammaproteobacteria bacterium]
FAAALGLNSAANAQEATMAVFAPSSGSVDLQNPSNANLNNVPLNGNISMIVIRMSTNVNAFVIANFFDILNPDGTVRDQATGINADDLPRFGSGSSAFTIMPGDLLRIRTDVTNISPVTAARGYINGNPPNLTMFVSVGVATASDRASGEFFINENGITTTTPAATNIGYAGEPTCDADADMAVDGDGLICELSCTSPQVENTAGTMCMDPLTNADCTAMMSGSEPNTEMNECVFTARSCSGIGGVINSGTDGCDFTNASCMELTPPGAAANTAGDDCTYTDDSCSAAMPGTGANDDNTACDFTDESCEMFRAGAVAVGDECDCPVDSVMLEGEEYCVNFAAPAENDQRANDLYTSANCENENAGNWAVAYELDTSTPAEVIAELCEIPYERPSDPAPAGGGLAPLQIRTGSDNNCVMRLNSGSTAAAADPLCGGASGLFANRGFPIKPPTGFDASTDRLTIDPTGAVSFGGDPVPQFAPAPPPPPAPGDDTPAAPAAKKSGQHALGVGAGLGVLVYLYAWHYYDGDIGGLFNFSPDYGYSVTENGYSYRYGGRLDFRNDDLHLYWKAGQANSNGDFGDFRYESGGEYSADFWTAAFSEVVRNEESDYDFSLSADYKGGIWRLSPTYRLRHSRFAEAESETANSLNLEGVLRYNRWTISPSAGFNWESADEFGDNARFNLSAVRRF